MKKLFTAIRASDFETVRQLIEKKPELVNCVAKQPPKKDDGQSPLQVALKTGNLDIAGYLLDKGADVNFIEQESCNQWKAPVIHDAINCAVMSCRWNTDDQYMGFRVFSTREKAEKSLDLLKRMLDMGADVNATDTYGNSGLNRFALQAKQILPPYNYTEHREGTGRIFTDELHEDLKKVLQTLKDAGADPSYAAPNLGYSVRKFCSEGSIAVLFSEVFGKEDADMDQNYGKLDISKYPVTYTYKGITYRLSSHPYEPCLYLWHDDELACTLHNAYNPEDIAEAFASGKTLTTIYAKDYDKEYDETGFCRLLATALDSGLNNMDLFYAAQLAKKK